MAKIVAALILIHITEKHQIAVDRLMKPLVAV